MLKILEGLAPLIFQRSDLYSKTYIFLNMYRQHIFLFFHLFVNSNVCNEQDYPVNSND